MDRFKPISDEDLDYIDKKFTAYLFYHKTDGGRYYECSCCREEGIVPDLKQEMTPEDYDRRIAKHGDKVLCPFCRAVCMLKNSGIAKERKNLGEERRFVLVETTEAGEVLLRALCTWRGYLPAKSCVEIRETKRWILTPGNAEIWEYSYYSGWGKLGRSLKDAFQESPYSYYYQKDNIYYDFIHLHKLKNVEFMRYSSVNEYLGLVGYAGYPCAEAKGVRYLCEYARYPRLEMLVKCGLESVVDELVRYGRKRKGIIDWEAKTPWGALYLSKTEYKTLMNTKDEYRYQAVECFHYWRKVNPKAKIENAIALSENHVYQQYGKHIRKYVFPLDISVGKISASLTGGQHGFWRDYIEAAEKLGYDLKNPVVVFPKNLRQVHDVATSTVKYEANKKLEAESKMSVEKRKKIYNFASGDYLIRVAENMQEIIDEGKTLNHCVGGYAERHMKEQTTILFVRRADDEKTPLCTVEYRNGVIIQAYCFKNTDPPEEIKLFLAEWLKYINTKKKKEEAGAETLAPAA